MEWQIFDKQQSYDYFGSGKKIVFTTIGNKMA